MPDADGNAQSMTELFAQVDNVHQYLHVLETTVDSPTLNVALFERDVLMICAALPVLEVFFPCIHDLSAHLQARFIELRRAQDPDWDVFGGA